MRKRRIYETTCYCSAYKFPHRFGGGRCSGRWIVKETWQKNYGHGECSNCNLLNEDGDSKYCEVLEGLEKTDECPAWQEFVRLNEIRIYRKKK